MDNPLLMPTYLTEEGDGKMEKRTEWGESGRGRGIDGK
jgi:hypothetical protein